MSSACGGRFIGSMILIITCEMGSRARGRVMVSVALTRACRSNKLTCGSRTAGAVPFFVSPKKGTAKKGAPELRDTPRPPPAFGARALPRCLLPRVAAACIHACGPSGFSQRRVGDERSIRGLTASTPIWLLPRRCAVSGVVPLHVVTSGLRHYSSNPTAPARTAKPKSFYYIRNNTVNGATPSNGRMDFVAVGSPWSAPEPECLLGKARRAACRMHATAPPPHGSRVGARGPQKAFGLGRCRADSGRAFFWEKIGVGVFTPTPIFSPAVREPVAPAHPALATFVRPCTAQVNFIHDDRAQRARST